MTFDEAFRYFLGPTGIPDRVAAANQLLSPVEATGRSMQASQEMLAPGKTPAQRVEAGGRMLTELATAVMPATQVTMAPARVARLSGGMPSPRAQAAAPAPPPIPEELLAYNAQVRTRAGMLDRDTIFPADNILYRPDRAYRFIGTPGYEDLMASGFVRAKQSEWRGRGTPKYNDPYFMAGKSSAHYGRGDSGAYMVETIPDPATWRGSEYIVPTLPLTSKDKIRVFQRQADGTYATVLDNIGDDAFLPPPSMPAR